MDHFAMLPKNYNDLKYVANQGLERRRFCLFIFKRKASQLPFEFFS